MKNTLCLLALVTAALMLAACSAPASDMAGTNIEPVDESVAPQSASAAPTQTRSGMLPEPAEMFESTGKPTQPAASKPDKPTPVSEATPVPDKPSPTPEPTSRPNTPLSPPRMSHSPEPAETPSPQPAPTQESEMEFLGSGYNKKVLAGVNDTRAEYGNAPLTLDSGLCAKARAHAEEMARQGKIFHSCSGVESVSNSTEGGYSMGVRSAAHATGLATDADRSRLGVGAVKYNGVQYACVFAPRD